jgi:hypothetical protein
MVIVTLLPLLTEQVGELEAEEESSPHAMKKALAILFQVCGGVQ